MTTTLDPRQRLQAATNPANIQSSKLMNDIPSWEREKFPLARFKGVFTGETREIPETTKNGTTFNHFALVYKVLEVHQKLDAQYQVGDTYNVIADGPPPGKEDKIANYAIGMMADSAIENGVNIWDEGVVVELTLTGRKPWPTADRATYFYSVSKGEGSVAPVAANPEVEAFIIEATNGYSGDDGAYLTFIMPKLSASGKADPVLEKEIANKTLLSRLVSEGKLVNVSGVYGVPA